MRSIRVLGALAAGVVAMALSLGACRGSSDEVAATKRDQARDDRTPASRDGERGTAPHDRDSPDAVPPAIDDPLVEQFRAVERAAIASFNAALAEQRANRIDELELAQVIERDVLEPWRAIRARVTAATVPAGRDALYRTLVHYLEARQISWEAYASSLRAPGEEAARTHLDVHRQKNAEAQQAARELGRLFREATRGGDARSP